MKGVSLISFRVCLRKNREKSLGRAAGQRAAAGRGGRPCPVNSALVPHNRCTPVRLQAVQRLLSTLTAPQGSALAKGAVFADLAARQRLPRLVALHSQ